MRAARRAGTDTASTHDVTMISRLAAYDGGSSTAPMCDPCSAPSKLRAKIGGGHVAIGVIELWIDHDMSRGVYQFGSLGPILPPAMAWARLVSSVATVSVVWFTSTFWRVTKFLQLTRICALDFIFAMTFSPAAARLTSGG
jgi:hypothetical protein